MRSIAVAGRGGAGRTLPMRKEVAISFVGWKRHGSSSHVAIIDISSRPSYIDCIELGRRSPVAVPYHVKRSTPRRMKKGALRQKVWWDVTA